MTLQPEARMFAKRKFSIDDREIAMHGLGELGRMIADKLLPDLLCHVLFAEWDHAGRCYKGTALVLLPTRSPVRTLAGYNHPPRKKR